LVILVNDLGPLGTNQVNAKSPVNPSPTSSSTMSNGVLATSKVIIRFTPYGSSIMLIQLVLLLLRDAIIVAETRRWHNLSPFPHLHLHLHLEKNHYRLQIPPIQTTHRPIKVVAGAKEMGIPEGDVVAIHSEGKDSQAEDEVLV